MDNNKKLNKEESENIRTKYSNAINLHNSEGQIQWLRYSAMLVINTVLVGLIGFAYSKDFRFPALLKVMFLLIPFFGILLCDKWGMMSKRGFYWINHWITGARKLEVYLPGGTNPVNEGNKILVENEEKEVTKRASLWIIDSFKIIYIILLVINTIFLLALLL